MRQWVGAVALAAGMAMPAQADVLFRFSGVVTDIARTGSVPFQPFLIGQSVSATLFMPWITDTTGIWEINNGRLYFDNQSVAVSGFSASTIQFGDIPGQKTLHFGFGMTPTAARGIGTSLLLADYCCFWSRDVIATSGENGQATLMPGGGGSIYLPESNYLNFARATIAGSWTAQVVVPEPATWALLGAGLLGMAAVRRRVSKAGKPDT